MALIDRWMGQLDGRKVPTYGDPGITTWLSALAAWPWLDFPAADDRQTRVLEIGCDESKWLELASQLDPAVAWSGIDWRGGKHAGVEIVRGDVLTWEPPALPLDAIVMISALEHIGLGHYNSDPKDEHGDTRTLERCARWLRPGGWVYADVPYRPEGYHVQSSHRAYDAAALVNRLTVPGLTWAGLTWANKSGLKRLPPGTGEGVREFPAYVSCLWVRDVE